MAKILCGKLLIHLMAAQAFEGRKAMNHLNSPGQAIQQSHYDELALQVFPATGGLTKFAMVCTLRMAGLGGVQEMSEQCKDWVPICLCPKSFAGTGFMPLACMKSDHGHTQAAVTCMRQLRSPSFQSRAVRHTPQGDSDTSGAVR